jgi:hypothetical protein
MNRYGGIEEGTDSKSERSIKNEIAVFKAFKKAGLAAPDGRILASCIAVNLEVILSGRVSMKITDTERGLVAIFAADVSAADVATAIPNIKLGTQ